MSDISDFQMGELHYDLPDYGQGRLMMDEQEKTEDQKQKIKKSIICFVGRIMCGGEISSMRIEVDFIDGESWTDYCSMKETA